MEIYDVEMLLLIFTNNIYKPSKKYFNYKYIKNNIIFILGALWWYVFICLFWMCIITTCPGVHAKYKYYLM